MSKYRKCETPYFEDFANVELFRWQYGAMPTEDDQREVDVMKGLGLLAEAIATGEARDTFSISQAVMRGAHEIDRLRAENDAYRSGGMEEHKHGACGSLCPWCEIKSLRAELNEAKKHIEEMEHELCPDPNPHLMGWEGDDE